MAYCCTDYDQNEPYKFPVFGAYGLNDRVNKHLVEVPVKNLENLLRGRIDVDKNFQIIRITVGELLYSHVIFTRLVDGHL